MNRIALTVALSPLLGVGVLAAPDAPAQQGLPAATSLQEAAPTPLATFGTASEVAHVVGAFEFAPAYGDVRATYGSRSCVGGLCGFIASLRLPSGALVSRIVLDACDKSTGGEITFGMSRTLAPFPGAAPDSIVDLTPYPSTGIANTPGCAFFTNSLFAPTSIDNDHFNYVLVIDLSTSALELSFSAVRVFYTLQVSPAPATATFSDVPPSHPFFQFVEALVASAITVGCGGGLYCVDNPITRGEMAVFLSKALGLHFAP